MEFCGNCDNMLYIKVGEGEQDTLLYYCRRCGSESLVGEDKMCVSKTTFKRSDQKAVLAINEHTKLDPEQVYSVRIQRVAGTYDHRPTHADVVFVVDIVYAFRV